MYSRSYKRKKQTRWGIIAPVAILAAVVIVVGIVLVLRAPNGDEGEKRENGGSVVDGGEREEENGGEVEEEVNGGSEEEVEHAVGVVDPDTPGFLEIRWWGVAYRLAPGVFDVEFTLGTVSDRNDLLVINSRGRGCALGAVLRTRTRPADASDVVKIGDFYYAVREQHEPCDEEAERVLAEVLRRPYEVRGGSRE